MERYEVTTKSKARSEKFLLKQRQQLKVEYCQLLGPQEPAARCSSSERCRAVLRRNRKPMVQRFCTQWLPELNQPRGQEFPCFWIASRLLDRLLTQ